MSDGDAGIIPSNVMDAEAAVISAVTLDAAKLAAVRAALAPEHFYSDANRRIYDAVLALHDAGSPVDVVTIAAWLRDRNRLDQVGGTPYLAQLTDATPAVAHVNAHVAMIVEAWRRRQIKIVATKAIGDAQGGSSAGVMATLRAELDRVDAVAPTGERTTSLPFLWVRDLGEFQQPPPPRWLLRDVRTGKPFMRAGECVVIGGDGGVGKGIISLELAACIAVGRDLFETFRPEQSGRVALLVGEDSKDEIHSRLFRVANAFGLDRDEIARVQERVGIFPLAGEQVNLLTLDQTRAPQRTALFEALVKQLADAATEGSFEWALIGLDPLARFGAANVETDQAAATAFVQALEAMAARLPGRPTVAVTHHSSGASVSLGKSNIRGVTGLRNAFRLAMVLDAYETPTGLRGVLLKNDKNNLAPKAPPLWLVRLDNEPMGGGRWLETAGVLRRATDQEAAELDAVAGTTSAATREQRVQAKQAEEASVFGSECESVFRIVPDAPESITSGGADAALRVEGVKLGDRKLKSILEHLARTGRIADLSSGQQSKPRKWARR